MTLTTREVGQRQLFLKNLYKRNLRVLGCGPEGSLGDDMNLDQASMRVCVCSDQVTVIWVQMRAENLSEKGRSSWRLVVLKERSLET